MQRGGNAGGGSGNAPAASNIEEELTALRKREAELQQRVRELEEAAAVLAKQGPVPAPAATPVQDSGAVEAIAKLERELQVRSCFALVNHREGLAKYHAGGKKTITCKVNNRELEFLSEEA